MLREVSVEGGKLREWREGRRRDWNKQHRQNHSPGEGLDSEPSVGLRKSVSYQLIFVQSGHYLAGFRRLANTPLVD